MRPKALVWFRNDLRISDNEVLSKALESYDIFPVFIFDNRHYHQLSELGFSKTGSFKTQFLIESVKDLKKSLQKLGSDLVIRTGIPEKELTDIAIEIGAVRVFASKEVAYDEVLIEEQLEANLFGNGVSLELIWQSTLFHQEDVPWPIKQVPEVFTKFRKEAEKQVTVRPLFETPKKLNPVYNNLGIIPTLSDLGLEEVEFDKRSVLKFNGGEKAAFKRLEEYFWKADKLKQYKETRNELIGKDYSSKLSPWLAVGAISAKSVFYEVKKYEQERVKNESTYWLVFELLWRDFFKFMAKKHGKNIFLKNGLSNITIEQNNNKNAFERWRTGKTGEPFIDANMKELLHTGFMSNRGRQIVASYLIHGLRVNWIWGAAWFEHALIDYDPASNWLNWAYIVGVGNDPRKGRVFNVESQQQRHDPKGAYVNIWN